MGRLLVALVCASACAPKDDDPMDGVGGSSEGDAAEDSSNDDEGSSDDDSNASPDPLSQRCTELFVTDDEIEDCVGFAEASLGDPMALVEACAAFDTDFRRWECMNAAAAATWPPEHMVEACVASGADLSDVRSCVLGCADAAEDPTPDFSSCSGSIQCLIEQCW